MRNSLNKGRNRKDKDKFIPSVVLFGCFNFIAFLSLSQSCPPNIDFETGTFNGWTCYTGNTAAIAGQNVISLSPSGGPSNSHHTIYSANTGERDPYGNFPVSCPNGSGYSVKLGNNFGGGESEGISYEFTIPANQNSYSLIYHYAVVFQAPNHRPEEQPRMEIEVTNLSDNSVINCASFTFISVGSSLPGFQVSNIFDDTTQVLYKDWSAVSVDLSGLAGKKIRLFFKTADCTFRRHFGYAYIDVNSECSGSFVGATYCPDDTAVTVTAPYGYSSYTWYDSTLTNVLGNQQSIRFSPPPIAGTTIAVKLEPFNGYGCSQTMYAHLIDSLTLTANAGKDTVSCNRTAVQIGSTPRSGLLYSWSPAVGLSNTKVANPLATPEVTTTYTVTTSSSGGGCLSKDSVIVRASIINNNIQLIGKDAYCFGSGDSTVLLVQPTEGIQWFRGDVPINGAKQTTYRVTHSGTYTAQLYNKDGCFTNTQPKNVLIERAKPGIRYPVEYAINNIPLTLKARPIGESVLWQPSVHLNTQTSYTPVYRGVAEQLYTIKLITTTGCLTVDTLLVKTIKNVEVLVPSAFTPNSDGKNDFLRPILKGIKQVRYFRVFNRWGELVFETTKAEPGWAGTFKSVPLQTQTIVWMFQGIGLDDKTYSERGTTVLLR